MTLKIIDASLEAHDDGRHTLTIVDYQTDTTEVMELPDQAVRALPSILGQMRKQLGTG